MQQFGEKIKSLRERKKITLEAMSDHLGVKLTTYAAREKSGKFDDAEIAKLLKKLGMTKEAFDAYKVPGKGEINVPIPGALINIQAQLDVLLSVAAELLAKQNNQSVTGTSNDISKAVQEKIDHRLKELDRS